MPWDRRTYIREYMRKYRANQKLLIERTKTVHQACDRRIDELRAENGELKAALEAATAKRTGEIWRLQLENAALRARVSAMNPPV